MSVRETGGHRDKDRGPAGVPLSTTRGGSVPTGTLQQQSRGHPAMLARVTTFEGGTADGIRAAVEQLRSDIPSGPPEGVKSTGLTMLFDADRGRVLFIGLFANEDDLRASEPALEAMSPPEGTGKRSSVDIYEVGADAR